MVQLPEYSLADILKPLHTEERIWSTGSFIFCRDRMLFAGVEKPDYLRVLGIGGRKEPGETLLGALKREGMEEASIKLQPHDSAQTCFLLDDELTQQVALPPEIRPRPTMVWTGILKLDSHRFDYGCAVWKCDFAGTPRPSAEIDCLLLIKPEDILRKRYDRVEFVGDTRPSAEQFNLIGSAARAPAWLKGRRTPQKDRLESALQQGRSLLEKYGAGKMLTDHSEKVAQVALAIGSRLAAAGLAVDPKDLLLAGLCHDLGRAQLAASRADKAAGHDARSADILLSEGMGQIAPLVANHSLKNIADGSLTGDPAARALFYADKAVAWCEIGTEPRFDSPPVYITDTEHDYRTARSGLTEIEGSLAAEADLTVKQLRLTSYLAWLSEMPLF